MEPHRNHVDRGDFRIAYLTLGSRGGAPLLLVHGLAASGRQFLADAEWFAERGFFVIVPDLRGHGRSTGPHHVVPEDCTRRKLVGDIFAILDKEGIESTDWVGNSLGGILALEAMTIAPQRLKRVVMFGTAFRLDIPEPVVKALAATYRAVGVEALATIGAPMTTRYAEPKTLIDSMLREVQAEPMLAVGANAARYDLREAARAFGRPILVVEASDDHAVNAANRKDLPALLRLPHISLARVEGAGHVANLDKPDEMRAIVSRFLANP